MYDPPPPAQSTQPRQNPQARQAPPNPVIASGEIRRGQGGSRYRGVTAPTSVNTNPEKQPDLKLRELNSQPTTPGPREEVYCTKIGAAHPGEIGHVHFQDTPDLPRELLEQTTRVIPGDGVAPLQTILRKLANKGYAGPLSVELFLPKFTQGDPFEVAREIRQKSEAVMRQARVI